MLIGASNTESLSFFKETGNKPDNSFMHLQKESAALRITVPTNIPTSPSNVLE